MILKVLQHTDPRLREIAAAVELNAEKESLTALVRDMFETMKKHKAVGLAAPQVGIPARLFVMDTRKPGDGSGIKLCVINPQIISVSEDVRVSAEGCLSYKDSGIKVTTRPKKVVLRFLDLSFVEREMTLKGLSAQCALHEIEHLDGILLEDKEGAWS